MGAIFVSYRRGDSEGQARAIVQNLVQHVGKASVFMDVDGIEPGRDFRQVLSERLASCDLMLVVIGSGWLSAPDAAGKRRLDDPKDYVRQEVAAALKRNIPVIPVLVQGASLPSTDQLPEDLKELAYRNSFELGHKRWESDVNEMIRRLGLRHRLFGAVTRVRGVVTIALVLLVGAGAGIFLQRRPEPGATTPEPAKTTVGPSERDIKVVSPEKEKKTTELAPPEPVRPLTDHTHIEHATFDAKLYEVVATSLGSHLRDLSDNEQLLTSGPAFDAFRYDILSGIRKAANELAIEKGLSLRLTVPNDSFFEQPPRPPDTSAPVDFWPSIQQRRGTPSTSINQKESEEFARLLSSQLGKANAVTTFNKRVSLATNDLARLRAMGPFQRILAQLRANIAQPLVRQRLSTEGMLGFATTAPELDEAQASGLLVSEIGAANNVARAWEPSDLDSRVTNLDVTIGQLAGFRELATDLSTASWQPLRNVAGLGPQVAGQPNPNEVTAVEFIAVAQQVERVRQELLEARGALTNIQRILIDRSQLITTAAKRVTADIVEGIQFEKAPSR